MNYGMIKPVDIADGPGVRVSLFVSGCRNHCPGCFQPETWDFGYGKPFGRWEEQHICHLMDPKYITGLSILGGDPMEPENIDAVTELCRFAKLEHPDKTIWLYTGYTFEELRGLEIMRYLDVVVDGRFIEAQKDLSLRFRGSANQRLIDVPASLSSDHTVLWADPDRKGLM